MKVETLYIVAAFFFGGTAGHWIAHLAAADPKDLEPIWFQKSECKQKEPIYESRNDVECKLKLQPRTMMLSFIPRGRFDIEAPKFPNGSAAAFARVHKQPCEIVIPADDAEIVYWPGRGGAMWENSWDMGTMIAHEILHCYTGYWHPSPEIMALRERRYMLWWWRQYRENPRHFVELYVKPSLNRQTWEFGRLR